MDSDEELAKKLQAEFDKEYYEIRKQEELDYEFASTLVAKHEISASESDASENDQASNNVDRKSFAIRHHDSDSDKTASESDFLVEKEENNHPPDKNGLSLPLKDEHSKMISLENKDSKIHELSDSGEDEDECKLAPSKQYKKSNLKEKKQKDEDTRKMCKYGAKCYQKNPKHRREFKHPESLKEDDEIPIKKRKNEIPSESSMEMDLKNTYPNQFGFYLTTVNGIPQKFNEKGAVSIQDILSSKMGQLVASAQFNYMTDIEWLISQYPSQFRKNPLLIVHGEQRESKKALEREASCFPNVTLSQAKLEILYGTHHTKMMLLLYEDGMRVVVHTANLIHGDWHQKTQGVWISPKFPKMNDDLLSTAGDSETNFKKDLLEYLRSYNTQHINDWCDIVKRHDFSTAKVFLIGSSPGRHVGERKFSFGHLKLRKVLKENGFSHSVVSSNWPVVGQFSSIGSLGSSSEAWLCKEFLASLSTTKNIVLERGFPRLQLIFPSVENVRLSLEGYPAGGSLPYSADVAKKQQWLNDFLNQWKSCNRGRSSASPHIKSYCRLSPDSNSISWFLVTSANLSKAAWGALEKNGNQLMIRSYELGVLFLPQFFNLDSQFQIWLPKEIENGFPLPYDLPLMPYHDSDEPWVWNAPHTDRPDSHGNIWSPS